MKQVSPLGTGQFYTVASTADLDEIVQASYPKPVLLFLDDPYCPISNFAAAEVIGTPAEVGRIDVAVDSWLAREVERRTGIRHASPQVILLHNGQACWSASHGGITSTAIHAALRDHGGVR